MKRALSIVFAVAALVTLLATTVFAAEVELSGIKRPVDASTLYAE